MRQEIRLFNNMKNSQSGQTIIEAMVALVTILLIITAISVVIVNGLYNSRFIKNQNEANKYAQQGMEFVRNIQKNDLATFSQYSQAGQTYCIDSVNNILTTIDCSETGVNTGTSYNRTVSFAPAGGECLDTPNNKETKATVTVKWSSTKCPATNTFCHKSVLTACLTYIYPESSP